MIVVCNVLDCRYNGGKFCKRNTVILAGGKCQVPYDKYGNVRPNDQWCKENLDPPRSEQTDQENLKN